MKRIYFNSATIFLIFLVASIATIAESGPPQRQLKSYALNGNTRSADISPDETLVATQITRLDSTNNPLKKKAQELVQLWDFRHERLVAEAPLAEVVTDKAHPSRDDSAPRFTRFTGDGKILVIYLDNTIYVLSSTDLRELRKIPMSGPAEEVRSYKNKAGAHPFVIKRDLRIFEVSPVGHKVAAIWVADFVSAQVEVYDLDSGEQLNEWNTGDRRVGIYPPKALQWEANGLRFVIAAPNSFPCNEPGNQPDLFVVDALTGAIPVEMTTGLLVGGIAVTPDDQVWAVDFDCLGVFVNHAPKMKVFDLHIGKRLRELSGRGSGVRFAVSASGNGNRVAAYTGKMKANFDWGDMVPFDETIDRTFTVWNASSYEAILTSQDVTDPRQRQNMTLREPFLRISLKGGLVLFGQNIYELPN